MRERKDANLRHVRNLERLKGKENITQSGQRIDICANVGTREDIENVLRSDAGGIGLFRSEFLYMEMGSKLPSEEQLFQVYKLAAESMGANRVVVRIADFGGDKMVESVDLGEQANPAIGLRGIRIMMEKLTIEAAVGVTGYEALKNMCYAFYNYAINNKGIFTAMLWYNKYESIEKENATRKIIKSNMKK